MMSENIARNMYSSQRIINYPTRLHLVGHFRILAVGIITHEVTVSSAGLMLKPNTLTATKIQNTGKAYTKCNETSENISNRRSIILQTVHVLANRPNILVAV
jgi:hypothetical protein